MLFVFILALYSATTAQKIPAWNITDCPYSTKSCRKEYKELRECDYLCFTNGTCVLKVAVILPTNTTFIVNMQEAMEALWEAEAYARNNGLLQNIDVNYKEFDDKCQQATATIDGLYAYSDYCSHLIIGSTCDYCTATLGRIAKFLGIHGMPVISPSGFTHDFTRKKTTCNDEYYMLVQTGLVDFRSFGEFFSNLMIEYGWLKVALFYEKNQQTEVGGDKICQLLFTSIIEDGLRIEKFSYDDGDLLLSGLTLKEYLKKQVGVKYGIVLICTSEKRTRELMLEAEALNMFEKHEYTFINFALYNNAPEPARPWYNPSDSDGINNRAKKAYKHLFTLTPKIEADYSEKGSTLLNRRGQLYLDGVYDGFLLYAHVLHDMLTTEKFNENPKQWAPKGIDVVNQMWGRVFQGRRNRETIINCNGQRVSEYALLQMNSSGLFHVVAEYHTINKSIISIRDIVWPGGKVPLDTPICGYDNSLCPDEVNIFLIVISVALSIGLVILAVFLYRHYKLEYEIASMTWKVQWEEIIWLPHTKARSSFHSTESLNKSRKGSQMTLAHSEMDGYSLAGDRQLFTLVGYYKGARAAIKTLKDTKIVLNRPQLIELKTMKDLSNDHLVKFYGACIDAPNCCILTEYCPKGSLQDILENEEVKLDWLFRLSLIHDVVRGMVYLHSSDIKSHGSLKSSNCVVDSRFVLKITDYGIPFLRQHVCDNSSDETSHSYWQRQLWTAPELLRTHYPSERGTQKGYIFVCNYCP